MKDCCRRQKHLKISVKFFQISERLLQRAETFKEFVKFFQIRERFTNFLPQEKLFAEAAKNTPKKKTTSRRSRKIIPGNRFDPSIKFIKDEEHAEKAKDFQLSDLAQRTDSRRIQEV